MTPAATSRSRIAMNARPTRVRKRFLAKKMAGITSAKIR